MQWTRGKNAGFSAAPASKLYLPVDRATDAPSVAEQEKTPGALLHRVREMVTLRRDEPSLAADAAFVSLYAEEKKYPFVYTRSSGSDTLLVALNPAGRTVSAEIGVAAVGATLLCGSGKVAFKPAGDRSRITMGPCSYGLYRLP
jgi:maltose alpha-D-glucosyltransferase/alpha-amylase